MAQAIGSPEELEKFARDLKQFNGQLAENMNRLQAQFTQLGDTWRDQEQQRYAQEFASSADHPTSRFPSCCAKPSGCASI